MKFTNDLFISYGHIDNERLVKASIGLQDPPFFYDILQRNYS